METKPKEEKPKAEEATRQRIPPSNELIIGQMLGAGPGTYTPEELTRRVSGLEAIVKHLADRLTSLDGDIIVPVATTRGVSIGTMHVQDPRCP